MKKALPIGLGVIGFILYASTTAATNKYSDLSAYPAPLTVDNISEKDKRNPGKVSQALANTFLEVLTSKEYSKEEISHSAQMLTELTCFKYNRKLKIEQGKPTIKQWVVSTVWKNAEEQNEKDDISIAASTRELAAGYAMCQIWQHKHVPIDRFTSFNVVLKSDVSESKE